MSDKAIYQRLSEEQPLPLFFRPWWLDMSGHDWHGAVVEEKGNIQAVWPYTTEKKAGVTIVRNPLMTPYLGPYFLLPEYGSLNKALNREDKIFEAFWELLPNRGFFEVQCLPGYNNFLPFHQKGFAHSQRVTYRIDLTKPEEDIYAAFDTSKKRHIKNAGEELVIEDVVKQVDVFYELHKETLTGKGKKYPYSRSFFTKLINTSADKDAGLMLTAKHSSGETAAMMFTVYDHETMYLLISAANKKAIHNGAVSLLVWEAIKKAKAMGLKIFDFEGSMDKGIEAFFRSFGGARVSYLSCTRNDSTLWKLKKAVLG